MSRRIETSPFVGWCYAFFGGIVAVGAVVIGLRELWQAVT